MKKILLLLIVLLAAFTRNLSAQAGLIDNGFGNGGKVTTQVGSYSSEIWQMAVQSDWSIVVGGFMYNGVDSDFALIRYTPDGIIDSSFGTNGMVTTAMGVGSDVIYSIGLQPDGKIIAGGIAWNGSNYDFALARYNTDGSLDLNYGNQGKVITAIGPGNDKGTSLKVLSDWSVVVGGIAHNGSDNDFALVRYDSTGALDNSFGTNGIVVTPIGAANDMAFSIALQSDWSVVVGGVAHNGSDYDFALVRYKANGTLDSTFGDNGKVMTPVGAGKDFVWSVALQPDDEKILLGGYTINLLNNKDLALLRYNNNGTLDSSFGLNGKAITAMGLGDDDIYSLVVQPDGKILAGGTSEIAGIENYALARYNSNGILDAGFGVSGLVTTIMSPGDNEIYSLALQPDGKIVAAGYSSDSSKAYCSMARYLSGLNVGVIDFVSYKNSAFIYPNPISQAAILEYELKAEEQISIRLLDMQGKLIKTFVNNQKQEAGKHQQAINLPEGLASGSYLLLISSPGGQMSIKIIK